MNMVIKGLGRRGVLTCLHVVLQGPKGELSWTFVPEVTLKEVGAGEPFTTLSSMLQWWQRAPGCFQPGLCSCSSSWQQCQQQQQNEWQEALVRAA